MEFTTQSPNGTIISKEQILIVQNDHKPLNKFLNGKNANNKVNRWGLELATYNITFKCISGACNKVADCLSFLVELPQDKPVLVKMLPATNPNGPAFNTRSQTFSRHFHLTSTTRCHTRCYRSYRSYTRIPNSR